jgi:2-haloacid dehalogenase
MAAQFPMPTPTVPIQPLTAFKSLSFDIYETLIQWESSIVKELEPLVEHAAKGTPYRNAGKDPTARIKLTELFYKHEAALQSELPSLRYDKILAQAYSRLAAEVGNPVEASKAKAFGNSVGK